MSLILQRAFFWIYLSGLTLISGTAMGGFLGWIKATSPVFAGTVYAVALGALTAVVLSGLCQWLILAPLRFNSQWGQWLKLGIGSCLGAINSSLAINLIIIALLVVLWPEQAIAWLTLGLAVGAIGGLFGGLITATVLLQQDALPYLKHYRWL